ncbi:hypothetical protein [Oricola sp.]|uniref:hypothetical protein n=1 Tax=Oricola sp. TaxID=1979950 RepID=UPI0025D66AA6|nr:hypothetical protein [Oricola sp.]MCI5074403.1 hypothetical protein [Oricola sp.]
MSEETIHAPASAAGRILPTINWRRLRQALAVLTRRRRMHVDALGERDRADLGLPRRSLASMDPRSAGGFHPHGF